MQFIDELLRLRGRPVPARVFRALHMAEIEAALEQEMAAAPMSQSLIIRWPPVIVGEVIDRSPMGKPTYRTESPALELWRFTGVGSYDEIRLAKESFGAPSDECFSGGPATLEELIRQLEGVFPEGMFRLSSVNDAMLQFEFADRERRISRSERAFLDRINLQFFNGDRTGRRMKQAHLSRPNGFVLGAV